MGLEKIVILNECIILSKAYINFDILLLDKQQKKCRISLNFYKSYQDYLKFSKKFIIFKEEIEICDDNFDTYITIAFNNQLGNLYQNIYNYLKKLPVLTNTQDVFEGEQE